MQISVINRQRRLKLSRTEAVSMANKLSEAFIDNLLNDPPAGFFRRKLSRLRQYGLLNLVFVSDRLIRKLNKQWRGKDVETDVLSFALNLEEPEPGMPWELGEIVISGERAAWQAGELNHSLSRELAFLFVHGMLHIFGFDHENKKDEQVMLKRQRAILKSAGYPRL